MFLLPNGETLLVDTGLKDTYDQVAQVLELAGAKEIHHLVLTHGHKDHIGGLKKLAKAYEIGTIYTNAYDKATYNDSERETIAASCGQWVRVKAGDSLSLGGWRRRSWRPSGPIPTRRTTTTIPWWCAYPTGMSVSC